MSGFLNEINEGGTTGFPSFFTGQEAFLYGKTLNRKSMQ
ncbi:hypothetical protein KP77_20410 [Jeotgalibacillus alimentarius]|uniref:Uncharacterized protein n=1 Tax=Jeotgalibacillus alimentarius TaxID=135826 RepID=A0A0C2RF55_9BACL|nr:hypothetical protein KP77_20410 [Jeotgalibacillus alimentarius]